MKGQLAMFSTARTGEGDDTWRTPPEVLDRVRRLGPIGLDPCTAPDNPVGAPVFFTELDDGLARSWAGFGLVFCNPPYSQLRAAWGLKIAREGLRAEIVSLVPARTETEWFREACWSSASAVCFWYGRLTFVGGEASAPFPSALPYHGPRPEAFARAFEDDGRVVMLQPARPAGG